MTNDEVKTKETRVTPRKSAKKQKKHRGIESLKSRYGRLFVLHWEIGLLLFFVVPLFKSLYFAFCDISFAGGVFRYDFVGMKNIDYAWNKDAYFKTNMGATLTSMLYSLPVIVILGVVIQLLFKSTSSELSSSGVSDSFAANMLSVDDILKWLSLPTEVGVYFSTVLNNIFNLVWNCGIQIVLFISGMQSIPDSLYEVSKVEGATKWEEFWFITLPMLARTLILVIIFTMVELITDKSNAVMQRAYTFMGVASNYGKASAMLWIYFAIVGTFIALVMLIYSKVFLKRWDTGGRS